MTISRLEAFSDGVIAIIITLLILDIHLPHSDLAFGWTDVLELLPKIAIFALSFVIIGTYWSAHHIFLSFARHVDRWVLWLNLGLLFFIALIPLVTGLLAEHLGNLVAETVYAAVLSMANIAGAALFLYLTRASVLQGKVATREGAPRLGVLARRARFQIVAVHLAPVAVYAAAAAISPISTAATLILFAAVPAFFVLGSQMLQPIIERARGSDKASH